MRVLVLAMFAHVLLLSLILTIVFTSIVNIRVSNNQRPKMQYLLTQVGSSVVASVHEKPFSAREMLQKDDQI